MNLHVKVDEVFVCDRTKNVVKDWIELNFVEFTVLTELHAQPILMLHVTVVCVYTFAGHFVLPVVEGETVYCVVLWPFFCVSH